MRRLHVAPQRDWLERGQMLRQGRLKWPLWQTLGWLSPRLCALCELAYIWRTPRRMDNQHLQALIGQESCTDWQRSIEQAVEQRVLR